MEGEGSPRIETEPKKDVYIVVLGGGLEKSKGKVKPVFDEKSRIIAGLTLVQQRKANHLIFSGGHAYREAEKTVAEYSEEYARLRDYKEILSPTTVKVTQTESLNTVSEFEELARIKRSNPKARIIVVSSDYHGVAKDLCIKNGFEFASAEEVILRNYKSGAALSAIDAIKNSPLFNRIGRQQKERVSDLEKLMGPMLYKFKSDITLPFRAKLRSRSKSDYS